MKRKLIQIALLTGFVICFLTTCKKYEHDNPWDENSSLSPDEWTPQNLNIENVSVTKKKLTWSFDDKNIQGFKIGRKANNQAWNDDFAFVGKDTLEWVDTTIVPDTAITYHYRITAIAGNQASQSIENSSKVVFPEPADFKATFSTLKTIDLSWYYPLKDIEGFKINRRIGTQQWKLLTIMPDTLINFVDTTFVLNHSVDYTITAVFGNYSSVPAAKTVSANIPQPQNVQLVKNNLASISLVWQDAANGEDGFRIERKYQNTIWMQLTTTTGTSYDDNNFDLNKVVSYRVYTVYDTLRSEYVENSFDATIPPPTGFQLTKNNLVTVTLTWVDTIDGEDCFGIDRKYESTGWTRLTTTTATSFVDDNFELNRTVYYRVCTLYDSLHSVYAEKSFNSAITAPQNLLVTPSSVSSVTLSWQYNENGHEGFKIDRKTGNGEWQNNYAQIIPPQANFVDNDVDLQNNAYDYRVYAFSGLFNSVFAEGAIAKPEITTTPPSNITATSVNTGGIIVAHGNYQITERGICWSTSPNPTISDNYLNLGAGSGNFDATITGLTPVTQYYFCVYVISSLGNNYGNQQSFQTIFECEPGFTDPRDEKYYNTVLIGTQCWMAENLNIGIKITQLENPSNNATIEKYCYLGMNSCDTYGGLYLWDEMMQYSNTPGVKGICPSGWHIPTLEEWLFLNNYLKDHTEYHCNNNPNYVGKSLAATILWNSNTSLCSVGNDLSANNSSGFSGLPAGAIQPDHMFSGSGTRTSWWSSSNYSSDNAYSWMIDYNSPYSSYTDDFTKEFGFSVRCLKD